MEITSLTFQDLPEGWTPLTGAVIIKCLDEDGDVTWAFRTTEDMSDEELLGALTVRAEHLKQCLVKSYMDPDEE